MTTMFVRGYELSFKHGNRVLTEKVGGNPKAATISCTSLPRFCIHDAIREYHYEVVDLIEEMAQGDPANADVYKHILAALDDDEEANK